MNRNSSQTTELQPLAEFSLITRRFQTQPAQLHLLHGHSGVFTAGLIIGSSGQQLSAVIDGAIRFNSYTLARVAAYLGLPAKILLRRTYVTRSFTAFQTEAAITEKLPRFIATHPCRIVIILGLLDTYYDEQVKPHECRQSLNRIVQTLKMFVRQSIHILIADVDVAKPPKGKENLFNLIRNAADSVIVLEPRGDGFHVTEERKTVWDEITTPSRLSSTKTGRRGVNSGEH